MQANSSKIAVVLGMAQKKKHKQNQRLEKKETYKNKEEIKHTNSNKCDWECNRTLNLGNKHQCTINSKHLYSCCVLVIIFYFLRLLVLHLFSVFFNVWFAFFEIGTVFAF